MAVSRGQTSPVNLKERIAALQQRSVSPNTHQSPPALRGLPSPGAGGLRDKIAKFEGKGGVPVPRGSFAMGVPPLTDSTPPKKRGELHGNRVPGLGRPSGPPLGSRSGSPLPCTDDDASPGPRKRCISTGAALSSATSSNFVTDEPVPALPNGLSAAAPRRNSLAVNFGPGRRVMSTSDVEGKAAAEFVDISSLSLPSPIPDQPPGETADSQPPTPEEAPVKTVLLEEEEEEEPQPSSLEAPAPVVEQLPPADSDLGNSEVDTSPASPTDPPTPNDIPVPIADTSLNILLSHAVEQSSGDGHSDYESAPQSAVPQPSPLLVAPSVSADNPSDTIKPTGAIIVSPSTPPSETTELDAASVPNPTVAVPPNIPIPNPTTESPSQTKSAFKAVVHRKVTELPVAAASFTLTPPAATPQQSDQRRTASANVAEVSPSLGYGDLAVLLEDAALLELRLTEGDGTGLKAKELLATTPTIANFQKDPRHASASTLTEHVQIPSAGSGSQSVRSVSIPSIREPLVDGEIPEGDETDGRSLASTTFSQRSPSHRKYLSNIYRLTSRRSSSYMPGAYPRDSMSLSSEDSSPVTTPSDNGKRKGFGIAWPTGLPKKDGPNISRSSSFADKIFNRNRTKSNVSAAEQVSERTSLYEPSQPSLTLSFPSELSSERHLDGVDINMGARPASWISPGDSNSEFSPASSLLDKDIFDAFPSVPQTLPPGFHLDAENAGVGRASTLPVNGRKQVNQRLSMM